MCNLLISNHFTIFTSTCSSNIHDLKFLSYNFKWKSKKNTTLKLCKISHYIILTVCIHIRKPYMHMCGVCTYVTLWMYSTYTTHTYVYTYICCIPSYLHTYVVYHLMYICMHCTVCIKHAYALCVNYIRAPISPSYLHYTHTRSILNS